MLNAGGVEAYWATYSLIAISQTLPKNMSQCKLAKRLVCRAFGLGHEKSKNSWFFATVSKNILDRKGPDACFCQYLQGFRITKKVVIMTIGISAL
jgi:hypothetical protein